MSPCHFIVPLSCLCFLLQSCLFTAPLTSLSFTSSIPPCLLPLQPVLTFFSADGLPTKYLAVCCLVFFSWLWKSLYWLWTQLNFERRSSVDTMALKIVALHKTVWVWHDRLLVITHSNNFLERISISILQVVFISVGMTPLHASAADETHQKTHLMQVLPLVLDLILIFMWLKSAVLDNPGVAEPQYHWNLMIKVSSVSCFEVSKSYSAVLRWRKGLGLYQGIHWASVLDGLEYLHLYNTIKKQKNKTKVMHCGQKGRWSSDTFETKQIIEWMILK